MHRQKKVLVIGSCVSHDVAKMYFGPDAEYSYLWRMSTPSLVSCIPAEKFDLGFRLSEEDRKTFERDAYKDFSLEHMLAQSDAVVLDLVRDSYDYINLSNGSVLTRGVEYDKYPLEQILDISDHLRLGTRAHFDAWIQAFKHFSADINIFRGPLIFVHARWMSLYVEDWKFRLIDDYDQYGIARRNFIIANYQAIADNLLPQAIKVKIPEWVNYADPRHAWGPNPIHLHGKTIARMVSSISGCNGELYSGDDAIDDRYQQELSALASQEILHSALSEEVLAAPEH